RRPVDSRGLAQEARPGVLRRYPQFTISPAILVALLVAWWFATDVLDTPPYIVPPPQDVLRAALGGLSRSPWDKASYWYHASITVWEAVLGFAIGSALGALLGLVLSHWPILGKSWYPYIVGFQSLPKVALAPLMVVWFGFGLEGKVFISAIIAFFPVLVNMMAGYQAVEPERIELARSCNASELDPLTKIINSKVPAVPVRGSRRCLSAVNPWCGGRRIRRSQRRSGNALDAVQSGDGDLADVCRHFAIGRDWFSDELHRWPSRAPLLLLGAACE